MMTIMMMMAIIGMMMINVLSGTMAIKTARPIKSKLKKS